LLEKKKREGIMNGLLIFCNNPNSHWLFVEGSRKMLNARLAYKKDFIQAAL